MTDRPDIDALLERARSEPHSPSEAIALDIAEAIAARVAALEREIALRCHDCGNRHAPGDSCDGPFQCDHVLASGERCWGYLEHDGDHYAAEDRAIAARMASLEGRAVSDVPRGECTHAACTYKPLHPGACSPVVPALETPAVKESLPTAPAEDRTMPPKGYYVVTSLDHDGWWMWGRHGENTWERPGNDPAKLDRKPSRAEAIAAAWAHHDAERAKPSTSKPAPEPDREALADNDAVWREYVRLADACGSSYGAVARIYRRGVEDERARWSANYDAALEKIAKDRDAARAERDKLASELRAQLDAAISDKREAESVVRGYEAAYELDDERARECEVCLDSAARPARVEAGRLAAEVEAARKALSSNGHCGDGNLAEMVTRALDEAARSEDGRLAEAIHETSEVVVRHCANAEDDVGTLAERAERVIKQAIKDRDEAEAECDKLAAELERMQGTIDSLREMNGNQERTIVSLRARLGHAASERDAAIRELAAERAAWERLTGTAAQYALRARFIAPELSERLLGERLLAATEAARDVARGTK